MKKRRQLGGPNHKGKKTSTSSMIGLKKEGERCVCAGVPEPKERGGKKRLAGK